MRFFVALCISVLLHASLVFAIYLQDMSKKSISKQRVIAIDLEKFTIEKPKKKVKKRDEKKPQKSPFKKNVIKKLKKSSIKKVEKKQQIVKKETKIVAKKVLEKVTKKPQKKEDIKSLKKLVSGKKESEEVKEKKKLKTISKAKKEPSSNTLEFKAEDFLAKIYKIIYEHKSYPLRAKKLHIQGEVITQFTLHTNGLVADIKVLQSSGAEFLDRHTIETIQEAALSFPKPPSSIEVKVPIAYFLR